MRRRLYLLPLLLLVLGCSRTPRPAAPRGAAPAATGGFPVTITDALRVAVTVPRRPQRITSLSPTVTEILFAIGAGKQVVAVTDQCSYPSEAKRLPKVGQWWGPSTERALARRPDLMVGQRGNPLSFVEAMRKFGVPVFTIDPQTVPEILATIESLGRLTGNVQGAARVTANMRQRLDAIKARLAGVPPAQRPSAFIIVQSSPVWTAGKHTFQDEAMRAAGARNVGDSVSGFKEFSAERLMAADPGFLLVTTMQGDPNQMKRDVLNSPVLKRLTAAKRGRVLMLEADEIDRPGPRLVNAIETMARAFYPSRFPVRGKGDGR